MKTFKCQFTKETAATRVLPDEAPPNGILTNDVTWEGPRPKALIRPYMAWTNRINQQLADEWGIRLMHAFLLPSGRKEVWCYEPQGRPHRSLIQLPNGTIMKSANGKRAGAPGDDEGAAAEPEGGLE